MVARDASFRMHSRNVACERPPRLRPFVASRHFFLLAQPPLLCKEGNTQGVVSTPWPDEFYCSIVEGSLEISPNAATLSV